jgi:chlorobactene glucosyltransferase
VPEGWLGKNWACQQLAGAAQGELLLFTDADTIHAPATLRDAVAALVHKRADFLSALPQEETGSWAERLTVPFFTSFSLFAVLPMVIGHKVHFPPLAVANGQFMLFRRAAYEKIGGYAAIRGNAIDDMALVREIASHKLWWRFYEGGNRIRCRMYHNFKGVMEGFSKNLFATFDYRVVPYVAAWLWLLIVFWEPLVVISVGAAGTAVSMPQLDLAVAAIAASITLLTILYLRFRHGVYLAVLYPITMLFIVIIASRSMAMTLSGKTTWKGRRLVKARPKLA